MRNVEKGELIECQRGTCKTSCDEWHLSQDVRELYQWRRKVEGNSLAREDLGARSHLLGGVGPVREEGDLSRVLGR